MHAMASSSYKKLKTKLKFSYWKIHQTWCRWLLKDFWLSCRKRLSEFLIIISAPAQQWLPVYKILVRCGRWKSGNNKIASWHSSLAKLNGKVTNCQSMSCRPLRMMNISLRISYPGNFLVGNYTRTTKKYCVRKFHTDYCGPAGFYLNTKKNWRIVW